MAALVAKLTRRGHNGAENRIAHKGNEDVQTAWVGALQTQALR